MTYSELLHKYNKIVGLLAEKRIRESFDILGPLADECPNIDYRNRLNNNIETYRNMLKYSFELGDDPEKEKVYDRLVKSILELSDEILEEIVLHYNLLNYYRQAGKKQIEHATTPEDYMTWIKQIELEQEAEEDNREKENLQQLHHLFNRIWLTDKLKEKDITLLKEINDHQSLPWHYKATVTSALSLSALRHFDQEKMILLYEFYQHGEHQVWQRALIGLLISLFVYPNRINLYPELKNRLKSLADDQRINKTVEIIVIQLLRAKETEKVSEKIREEIMPEIWKIRSTLEDKLNMGELLSENMLEDKNPEWETVFEDSPDLYNKIEEFSNLQMEGADVFLSALAMMKRFDFFNQVSNWFLPFYKENPQLSEMFRGLEGKFDSGSFLQGLERTAMLCNSDKYSFCLNVRHMPDMQKSMMVEFFNMELNAMNEMEEEDEILRSRMKDRSVFIQYIQDLYRFFRLHPYHREINDIFSYPLDFHNKEFFRLIVNDDRIIRNIGEFYFEKSHFQEALDIFLSLEEKNTDHELLEKAAYCYQALGQFENALSYYKKAELISRERPWLLNKIAFCNRRLRNYDEAVEYYSQSEKLDPENLYVQTSLGQVYMDKGDYEEALKYFFKVEYLAPDNIKVHRPIAWCSFVVGKLDNAQKYFEKITLKEGNRNDFLNLGHVYWCKGEKQKAIENYRTSLKKSDMDFSWFSKYMKEDSRHLIQHGIPEFDIPLMLDYLRIRND